VGLEEVEELRAGLDAVPEEGEVVGEGEEEHAEEEGGC
jgi:hypothetical protein